MGRRRPDRLAKRKVQYSIFESSSVATRGLESVIWQVTMSHHHERIASNRGSKTAPVARPELTLVATLKFAVVIGFLMPVTLLFSPSSLNVYLIVVGGATGMFVAQSFCRTRSQQFFALLVVPALFGAVGTVLLFLDDPDGVTPTSIVVGALIGFFVAIGPAAVLVVAISLVCKFAFLLTGIQFLKFDWGVAETVENDHSPLVS